MNVSYYHKKGEFMHYFPLYFAIACSGNAAKNNDDTAATTEPSVEDTGPPWVPGGSGIGYLLDGDTNNSLFTLELTNATTPPEGETYSAYLLGGSSEIALGELSITDSEVYWQAEIGFNGLMDGVNRFEARLSDGTVVYGGNVDPQIEQAYRQLLIASPYTPEGDGSIRALQSSIQRYIEFAQEGADLATNGDFSAIQVRGEMLFNSIYGIELDRNNDGQISKIENILPITHELNGMSTAETFLVELVLDDLALGSSAVDPGHPIKDLANYAYDCTQLVEQPAREAAEQGDAATACGSVEFCSSKMQRAKEYLESALMGTDIDGDGSISLETEASIQCALYHVNQMAYMEIAVEYTGQ